MQDTLLKRIRDAKNGQDVDLSSEEQDQLYSILGKKCQRKTKNKLESKIALPLSLWPEYGILGRVLFTEYGVEYCAGQSYPDEIRTVREIIIKM